MWTSLMFFPFSQTKYEEAKKAIAAKGKQLQQKVSWNITANMISANSVSESLYINGCQLKNYFVGI